MDLSITPEAFFYYHLFLFGNLWREVLIEVPSWEKREPVVKIVENLTFMLAKHLIAVKDVIFFWPITSPKIFNPYNHMTRRAIKISSNQKRRSKADGTKVRIPTVLTRGFLFSALGALCQFKKNKRSGSHRKICQERIKNASGTRVSLSFLSFFSFSCSSTSYLAFYSYYTNSLSTKRSSAEILQIALKQWFQSCWTC